MTKYQPPADPKAPWRVVLCTDGARDAAIDEDRCDAATLVDYVMSRDPAMVGSAVPLRDGVAPTWWTLAPLSFAFVTELLARETSPERQRILAARAALVRVEGPMGEGLNLDAREQGTGGMNLLVASEIERVYQACGYGGVLELGDTALVRARLRPGARGPFGLCR